MTKLFCVAGGSDAVDTVDGAGAGAGKLLVARVGALLELEPALEVKPDQEMVGVLVGR